MSKLTKAILALGIVAGLGAASLPLSSYAAEGTATSSPVKVSVTVDDSISISTDTTNVDFGAVTTGKVHTQSMQVTVKTSDENGYTLKASTDAPDGAMQDVNQAVTPGTATTNTIAAITGSTFTTGTAGWGIGYYKDGTLTWSGLKSAVILKEDGAGDDVEDLTTVLFGVQTDGAEEGTYAADVTFTATVNPE